MLSDWKVDDLTRGRGRGGWRNDLIFRWKMLLKIFSFDIMLVLCPVFVRL